MVDSVSISLTEQIEELRRKIALLDGDRKAYFENSQWTMQINKDAISKLRTMNKALRLDLAKKKAGDRKIIDDAFQDQDTVRQNAVGGISGKDVVAKLDQKVCEVKKRINSLNHQLSVREKKLASLQVEYEEMQKDVEMVQLTSCGESDEAQRLRVLENSLDKMNLKLNEAAKIRHTYEQILEHQKEESRTWPNALDSLEQTIKEQNDELKELYIVYNDAQIARDTARSELAKFEQTVTEAKKDRELQLAEYKRQAEEKKDYAEKVEKRLQRTLQQDDLNQDLKSKHSSEEQERKITTYEEAMAKIKDATGVSDIKEVVQRFLSQGETQNHLQSLKLANEKVLAHLKEEKERLQTEFEEMKYSGEAKLSNGEKMLEELREELKVSEAKLLEAKNAQQLISRSVADVKSGIAHLADKLLPKSQLPPLDSENFIMDTLKLCETKLTVLVEELGGKDIGSFLKEMEDAEFRSSLETKLPAFNTRIKLPTFAEKLPTFDDDEDSGAEDDYLSRNAIKQNSQQIVDSKTKKNKTKKKKNKK
ncbi:outer dynein arm-docking complex subunit 3 isoform X1 [Hydra vulgaris]|nr:outer dynein arm-docking complex subunit 3 [Hydra vulgaris]